MFILTQCSLVCLSWALEVIYWPYHLNKCEPLWCSGQRCLCELAGAACFFLLFCNLIIFHFSILKLLFRSKNTVLDPVQCSFCIYYMLLLAILVLFVFNSCYCIWLPCKLSANVTTVLLVIFCIIRPTFSLQKLISLMSTCYLHPLQWAVRYHSIYNDVVLLIDWLPTASEEKWGNLCAKCP